MTNWNQKPDVVDSTKEAKIKYNRRNIYCIVVDDEKFYAGTTKYDVEKLLSSSPDWCLSPENFDDIKAFHGFLLDTKNLPEDIKPNLLLHRKIILIREFVQGNLIEVTELDSIDEAAEKIEEEISKDGAEIDEYLLLVGGSCELALAIKEAQTNVLLEREIYGD